MANEEALLEDVPVTTEVEAEEPTLRESIEEAVEEHEEPAEPSPEPAPSEAPATEAKREVQPREVPTEAPAKGLQDGLKAPAQWKPAVREKWNSLPREVQEEVIRRESDNMRLIGSVGPKIRLADEVVNHIQPFAEQLNANGVAPQAFLNDIFTTVKSLSAGNPQEKAEVVANIVQSYGVDLRQLDAILSSRLQAGPESTQARALAARANAVLQQNQGAIKYQSAMEAQQAVGAFGADPKHEFLDDVRDLMADLIETGRVNSLDDAYSAAVWAHPDTRKILLQRESLSRAGAKGARAVAARRASSAVHGAPNGPAVGALNNPNLSLRDTIALAIDEQSSP